MGTHSSVGRIQVRIKIIGRAPPCLNGRQLDCKGGRLSVAKTILQEKRTMSQKSGDDSANKGTETQHYSVAARDLNTEPGRGKRKNGSSGTGIGHPGNPGTIGTPGGSDYAGGDGSGFDSGNFPH